jgi:phage terminase Nu1 subunit (DNA packaging protein)
LSRHGTDFFAETNVTYLTRSGLMRATGRSRREIDALLSAGLPHQVTGQGRGSEIQVDADQAMAWLVSRVLDGTGTEPGGSPELIRERTRLAKAQADKTELENATARKELLPAAEVARADEVIFAALRDRVLHVASVAPLLVDAAASDGLPKVRELLRQALVDALEEVGSAELVPAEAG